MATRDREIMILAGDVDNAIAALEATVGLYLKALPSNAANVREALASRPELAKHLGLASVSPGCRVVDGHLI